MNARTNERMINRRDMASSSSSSSSSGSDGDGDDEEEAERLRSVAVDSATIAAMAAAAAPPASSSSAASGDDSGPALKFYQSRARDLLNKYIDNALEIKTSKHDDTHMEQHNEDSSSAFYLFRCAPPGLSDEHPREEGVPKARKIENVVAKRIKNIDEDSWETSKKFQSCILGAAIDGMVVKANADKAASKAFSSLLAYRAKENEARRKEEERIALLKAKRGERWLPSVSKDMALEKVLEDQLLGEVRRSRHKKQLGTYI